MIRKHPLFLLVSFFALLLMLACGEGEQVATAAPADPAIGEAQKGQPEPSPPDFDVKPGKGGETTAEDVEMAANDKRTVWRVDRDEPPKYPTSQINRQYLGKVESMTAYDSVDASGEPTGEGKAITQFILELTSCYDDEVRLRVVKKSGGKLAWYLQPKGEDEIELQGRGPKKTYQLPVEFFWDSETLDVVYEGGSSGTAELVRVIYEKQ